MQRQLSCEPALYHAVSRMNVYIGGAALPIGRTYKDAFTEAFSRYMAKKEWEDPCRS